MGHADETPADTYNPWSIVNLVFHHLASEGLKPPLRETRRSSGPPRSGWRRSGRSCSTRPDRRWAGGLVRPVSHVEIPRLHAPGCDSAHEASRAAWTAAALGRARDDYEPPERGEGPSEDSGTVLGTAVPRAGLPVRNGLHVRQGAEEGPAQASAPVVLTDAGRKG